MAGKGDGDLDRSLEIAIKLGQQILAYTSSIYFFLCTTGTILFNICEVHWNNMMLP